MDEFIESSDPVFILKGYAGTGKTFLLDKLAAYLEAHGRQYSVLAPTGRAARVISEKSGQAAETIHRGIYQIDTENRAGARKKSTGRLFQFIFELKENDMLNGVILVDEASMISDLYSEQDIFRFGSGHLLQDLIEFVNIRKNKIIFFGDPAQLPPVNSEYSPALSPDYYDFNFELNVPVFEMTDIVRQKEESSILANATALRNSIRDEDFYNISITADSKYTYSTAKHDFMNDYIKACGNKPDPETILIAFTNRQVSYYNEMIRKHFFPSKASICKGDRVMVVNNTYNYKIDLMNGEIGEVIRAGRKAEEKSVSVYGKEGPEVIKLVFRDLTIRFPDFNGKHTDIICKIYEPLLYSTERDIGSLETQALYQDFRGRYPGLRTSSAEYQALIKHDPYLNCLRVKFGYAITCHKSQGGEWSKAFIDFKAGPRGYNNIGFFRWAYTAITRAAEKAWYINEPVRKVNLNIENDVTEAIRTDKIVPVEEIPFTGKPLSRLPVVVYSGLKTVFEEMDIDVKNILTLPGCDKYLIAYEGAEAGMSFWYSGNKVKHVDIQPGIDEIFAEKLERIAALMNGREIEAGK